MNCLYLCMYVLCLTIKVSEKKKTLLLAVTGPVTTVDFGPVGDLGTNRTVAYLPGFGGYPSYITPSEEWSNDPLCPQFYQANPYVAFEVCLPANTVLGIVAEPDNTDVSNSILSIERVPEGTCAAVNDTECGRAGTCISIAPRTRGQGECFIVHLHVFYQGENILSGLFFTLYQDAA